MKGSWTVGGAAVEVLWTSSSPPTLLKQSLWLKILIKECSLVEDMEFADCWWPPEAVRTLECALFTYYHCSVGRELRAAASRTVKSLQEVGCWRNSIWLLVVSFFNLFWNWKWDLRFWYGSLDATIAPLSSAATVERLLKSWEKFRLRKHSASISVLNFLIPTYLILKFESM